MGDTGLKALQERGRMQEGMIADITIFNPKTVAERSAYKAGENTRPPTGIPHVMVSGQFVVRDGKARQVYAGRPIRFPVEEKGHHVPATQIQWLSTFAVDSSPMAPREGSNFP